MQHVEAAAKARVPAPAALLPLTASTAELAKPKSGEAERMRRMMSWVRRYGAGEDPAPGVVLARHQLLNAAAVLLDGSRSGGMPY